MATINLIYACDINGCIGKNNSLPFKLSSYLKFFKDKTSGGIVVMGRKTFESIGKPLKNRKNIVLSKKSLEYFLSKEIEVFQRIDNTLLKYLKNSKEEVFIIGGAEIYKQFLPHCDVIYKTEVDCIVENGDVFFTFSDKNMEKKLVLSQDADNTNQHSFNIYKYIRH